MHHLNQVDRFAQNFFHNIQLAYEDLYRAHRNSKEKEQNNSLNYNKDKKRKNR
jgi:hypothetical protein